MINEFIICKFSSGRGSRISKFTRFSIFYRRQKSLHGMYMYYMTYPLNFIHCQQTRGIYQRPKSTHIVPHLLSAASLGEDAWLLFFFVELVFQSSDGPEEESTRATKNTTRNSTIRSRACVPFRWTSELTSRSQFRTCSPPVCAIQGWHVVNYCVAVENSRDAPSELYCNWELQ